MPVRPKWFIARRVSGRFAQLSEKANREWHISEMASQMRIENLVRAGIENRSLTLPNMSVV